MIVAGPSGTGKSFLSSEIISSAVGPFMIANVPRGRAEAEADIGNNFVYIDGGKVRSVSNVRSLGFEAQLHIR